jgi:hypothetical protein
MAHYGPSLVTGKAVYGTTELGILGSVVRANTAVGTNGAGILYNDWDNSSDDSRLFRALVISGAPSGAFFYEDGSFYIPSGTPNGAYSIAYDLYINGALQGSTTAQVNIGAAPSSFTGAIQLDDDSVTGFFTSGQSSNFVGNVTLDDDSITGSFYSAVGSVFVGNIQLDDDRISGRFFSSSLPNPLAPVRIYKMPADAANIAPNIPTYYKDRNELLDYGFDATDVLAQIPNDTVSNFDIRANVGLEILAIGLSETNLYGVLLGGGYNQALGLVTCRLTMASGRVIESSIYVKIDSK